MHFPEWEIEESLASNPDLLGFDSARRVELVERQKYLKNLGGYIDLLFKHGDVYLIVEVKSNFIDEKSVVTNQLLKYKKSLSDEFGIPQDMITCVLTTPAGFSEDVIKLCQKAGIITRKIDQKRLISSISKLEVESHYGLLDSQRLNHKTLQVLSRRGFPAHYEQLSSSNLEKNEALYKEINSVNTLVKEGVQDEHAKKAISHLFALSSKTAAIQSHEVYTSSNGRIANNRDSWFWLFYSVMDRRANAATFVKAREALRKERLFSPYKIVKLVKDTNEKKALNRIAKILENQNFPLLRDHTMGKLSFPKSIVDAARFMSKYGYDFANLYKDYVESHQGSLSQARDSLWNDLRKKIYGAGPRISSQFIRGMALKGSWKFPLDDNRFLEKCRFNVWIAGKTRLCLIENEDEYYNQLGKFADDYLNGNRGIIAHSLWYIRKRYCNRPPKCDECPVAGYCLRACSTVYPNSK